MRREGRGEPHDGLYKLTGDALTPVAIGRLAMVEGWIAKQPDLLGLEMLAILHFTVTRGRVAP